MTLVNHFRGAGEELGAIVGNPDPGELEVSERLVEPRQSCVHPGLEIPDRRVVCVGHCEQEDPPLALHSSCPQLSQLA